MSDIKSSLDKIKILPKEPVIYHTKGALFEKLGKIDNAIKQYKLAADCGYDKSQYALANIYYLKKQYSEAEKWDTMAYKNGIIDAAFDIGNMYFNVEGYEHCLYWYEKAASQGHLKAQNNLGVSYFKLEKYNKSEKWLKEACDSNLRIACFNLGILYKI